MLRSTALLVAFVALCLPVLSSEPGQPLDSSDWVFFDPGFSANQWTAERYACHPDRETGQVRTDQEDACFLGVLHDDPELVQSFDRMGSIVDASGTNWALRHTETVSPPCASSVKYRTELLRCLTPESCERIGILDERCHEDGFKADKVTIEAAWFDNINGRLLVRMKTFCQPNCTLYEILRAIVTISGFPTLFEVFQSYIPAASLSLVVPQMPEGMAGADYFDTYWGDLATVGDWSQAQPLRCGYPATPPNVGDYLTVEDTLPTLPPGHGYYYLTAVNYQGQRRYGRQSNGGVLTGRDPSVLPICE